MRKIILEPELEVVRFGTEDIITTSFVNDGGTEGKYWRRRRILMSGGPETPITKGYFH